MLGTEQVELVIMRPAGETIIMLEADALWRTRYTHAKA
jgi:hypothetical protein